jgi:ribonuclease P protein component
MSKRFAFPRQARLLTERDFQRVHARGMRFSAFPLRFRALRRPEGGSRLGLAIGAKVGNAVVRNRWKRTIRESFRLNRHRLLAPHDVVASVDWQASLRDLARAGQAFLSLVEALNAAVEPEQRP